MNYIKPATGADFLEVFLGSEILVSTSPPLIFSKKSFEGGEVGSNTADSVKDVKFTSIGAHETMPKNLVITKERQAGFNDFD